jgi:hypothetical protein
VAKQTKNEIKQEQDKIGLQHFACTAPEPSTASVKENHPNADGDVRACGRVRVRTIFK